MERIINKEEVLAITGISDTTLDRMEKRGEFPSRRRLSPNRVGWMASEVFNWVRRSEKLNVGGEEE